MTARLKNANRTAPRHPLRRFARDDDGSMMIFVLSLVIIMLMLGGMAVDLMRYEQRQTLLQQTSDRASLAAAKLTQDLDPTSVVEDYFDKAGLSEYLRSVNVDEGVNFRTVQVDAEAELQPFFMQMMDIDRLEVPAASTAEQRITNVEITMVLDVSGSMQGAKIANLKTAAKEFVDTVKERDTENRITITVVPYNAQVNLGATLRGQYNATNLHNVTNVNCLELPTGVFSSATISRNSALPMMAFADTVSGTPQSDSYTNWTSTANSGARIDTNDPFCRNTAANIVRLPSINTTTIKNNIDALVAAGNTSITLGMKWGLALTEPNARPMFNTLINAGQIPTEASGRPYSWVDDDSMKVIILMTDGEHVAHTRVNDAYKTGLSPIYRSAGDGNYSIRHTTSLAGVTLTNQYYVPHRSAWQSTPWNSGGGVAQMQWQDVWANQRVSWVAWQLYARALGTSSSSRTTVYNNTLAAMQSTWASVAAMNSTLQQSCALAKDNGVVVYGIAFEAPTNGRTQILNCASSPAHYFDANGLEIQTAFRAIASNISQLRLTQ
ncbi:MAG: pilus assembly protein TadG-related protein [Gemmobacter sp.]